MEADRAIQNLIFRYAELVDAGDFDGIGQLFAHGRIVAGDGTDRNEVAGAAAVTAMYEATTRRYSDDGTPHTKHLTSNVIVEVEPGSKRANARSYFTVLQQVDDMALQPIISGRYHDRFHVVDRTWRFDSREMIVDLLGDLGRHLLIEL